MKPIQIVILAALSLWTIHTQAAMPDYRASPDPASRERGALLFMDNCASCHSLKYLRYEQLHQDLGLTPAQVKSYEGLTQSTGNSPISAQLTPELTQKMFGMVPPDLSLISHARSPDWVYRYMLSFYPDSSRPSGFNNHVFADVAMPNVLAALQAQVGDQVFASKIADLVNFLQFAADPKADERQLYGLWVLLFLVIFLIPVYLLNREYWKQIR